MKIAPHRPSRRSTASTIISLAAGLCLATSAGCSTNSSTPAANGGKGGSPSGQAGSSGQAGGGGAAAGQPGSAGAVGSGGASAGGAGGTGNGGVSGGAAGAGSGGNSAGGGAGSTSNGGSSGGAGGSGGMSGGNADGGPSDGSSVAVHDGAVGGAGGFAPGAYVRTGWTATYTCKTATTDTSMCLRNGNTPGDTPAMALDGDYSKRWSTDAYQEDLSKMNEIPVFFTVDMKQVMNVSKLMMHPGCMDAFDVPGTMEVYLSVDGTSFGSPIVTDHHPPYQGPGCSGNTPQAATFDTITFAPTAARYIQLKMTQTLKQAHGNSTGDRFWAIGEFYAFP